MLRRYVLILVPVALGCGDDSTPNPAQDASTTLCTQDSECDDGVFCNGVESCDPDAPLASRIGCLSGDPPCPGMVCDEDADECGAACADEDEDGHSAAACGGDDCDDADSDRYPGNTEICDPEGHDEDCDPATVGERDVDGDGFVDAACCNGSVCGEDCVDTLATVSPGGTETCDGTDQDCDGAVDEDLIQPAFADDDGDLHGDSEHPLLSCPGWAHVSTTDIDCDDANAQAHGLQLEICDGEDNDCDGEIDEDTVAVTWFTDADGDGFGEPRGPREVSCEQPEGFALLPLDCDDDDASRSPSVSEQCNGIDDDCDGIPSYQIAPGNLEDDDRDGHPDMDCEGGTDCNDRDPFAGPGMYEHCDGVDNDCDGTIDEDPSGEPPSYYRDEDGDGVGGAAVAASGCARPSGRVVTRGGDCADSDPMIGGEQRERCDGEDNDCDGQVDEGTSALLAFPDEDGDGFGAGPGTAVCEIPAGQVGIPGDCADDDVLRYFGAIEICNELDDDCDGVVDEMAVVVDWYVDGDGDGFGDPMSTPVSSCEPVTGRAPNGSDCDDGSALINPNASETCDGADEDCDEINDEGVSSTVYRDSDMDGAGDDTDSMDICGSIPGGYVATGGDCDDGDATRNPFATELCDDIDQDCDGNTDEGTAVAMCVGPGYSGACGPAGTCACDSGLGDCNVTSADGCEAQLAIDPDHCGGCGLACGVADGCTDSSCDQSPIVGLSTDFSLTCLLRANGNLACTGRDWDDGFLSVDSGVDHYQPILMPVSGEHLAAVGYPASGGFSWDHRCVLQDAGATIRCWGHFTSGELGDGTTNAPPQAQTVLVATPPGATYAQLALGEGYSCARRTSGEVDCWGRNNLGQLGVGDTNEHLTPTPVVGVDDAIDISVGKDTACLVRSSGSVACWGRAGAQLGDRGASPTPNVPNDLVDISDAVDVEVGQDHACIRDTGDEVRCWGFDTLGQLGDGTRTPNRALAAPVVSIGPAVQMAMGNSFSCAVLADARVACWGSNDNGQIGYGSSGGAGEATPRIVVDEMGIPIRATMVSASLVSYACAALTSGGVACWGRNDNGRLGLGFSGMIFPYAQPMLLTQ